VAPPIDDLAVCGLDELVSLSNASPTGINPSLSRISHRISFQNFVFLCLLCGFLVFYRKFLAFRVFSCILSSHSRYFYCSFGSFKVLMLFRILE
jgi:hypothetical protein